MDGRFRQHDRERHKDVHRSDGGGQQAVRHQVRVENRTENGTPQRVDTVPGAQLGRRREENDADENPLTREIRSEGECLIRIMLTLCITVMFENLSIYTGQPSEFGFAPSRLIL